MEAAWKNCSNSDGNYRTSTLLNTNCCRPTTNRGGPTRLKISWSMRQTAGPGRHLLQILHCPQESTDNLKHVRLHMSEKSRMETCGRKKGVCFCSTHNPTEPFCGNLSDWPYWLGACWCVFGWSGRRFAACDLQGGPGLDAVSDLHTTLPILFFSSLLFYFQYTCRCCCWPLVVQCGFYSRMFCGLCICILMNMFTAC